MVILSHGKLYYVMTIVIRNYCTDILLCDSSSKDVALTNSQRALNRLKSKPSSPKLPLIVDLKPASKEVPQHDDGKQGTTNLYLRSIPTIQLYHFDVQC